MTIEEKYITYTNMQQYGGSFVQALGTALMCADNTDTARIERAFPELIERYFNYK